MGKCLEVSDAFVTAGGAQSFTGLTAYNDVAFGVRSFPESSAAWLIDFWGGQASDNQIRIRSPRLHDNVRGIEVQTVAAVTRGQLSDYAMQRLHPNDVLVVEATSEAAETDGVGWLTYYEDLPGIDANLHAWAELAPRVANLFNVEVDLAAATGVGVRTASVAINGTQDLFKGDVSYAVLGYASELVGTSIGIRGPDTGNIRLGGPKSADAVSTRDYFIRLGEKIGKPTVPVIQANNKTGTFVDATGPDTLAADAIVLVMAELAP